MLSLKFDVGLKLASDSEKNWYVRNSAIIGSFIARMQNQINYFTVYI